MASAAMAITVLSAIVLAACGGTPGRDRLGGAAQPVVLHMANGYSNLDYEPAVDYFVKRVEEVSGGALRIAVEHKWGWGENLSPGFEQDVVRDVAAGKVDLAWAGTRVFDTLEFNGFQALTAPMLIDSYAVEKAVIGSQIPRAMMEGLDQLGLVGLGILADGLRKPIAVERPLFGPEDWDGITFAAFRSNGHDRSIEALGARPIDVWGEALDQGLESGQIDGFEKSLLIYKLNGMEQRAPYVTANVNLWPQTAILLANPARFSTLTDEQRGWLQHAADEAVEQSLRLVDGDDELTTALCESGARFATASDGDIAAMREAFAPVYQDLQRDPRTKGFIADIAQLKEETPSGSPPMVPADCTVSAAPTDAASGAPSSGPTEIDGVYQMALTRAELVASPLVIDADELNDENWGEFTMTLQRGRVVVSQQNDVARSSYSGTYSVHDDVLELVFDEAAVAGETWRFRWSFFRDTLSFARDASLGGESPTPFLIKAWTKVG